MCIWRKVKFPVASVRLSASASESRDAVGSPDAIHGTILTATTKMKLDGEIEGGCEVNRNHPDMFINAICLSLAIYFLLCAVLFGAIIVVAWHFIAKYW